MSAPTARVEDADTLGSLEERILRAVELVGALRREKEAAEVRAQEADAALEAARKSATDLEAENSRLTQELETLRGERKQVRSRIEKLLGQLDTLAS